MTDENVKTIAGVEYKMVCAESPKGFTTVVNNHLSQGFLPMGQHTHSHSVTPDGVEYMQICIGLAKDAPPPLGERSAPTSTASPPS